MKVRYKYRLVEKGFQLKEVKCPICQNPVNWIKPVNSYNWNHTIVLLAECWSGEIAIEKPSHLFLIEIKNLPIFDIEKRLIKYES